MKTHLAHQSPYHAGPPTAEEMVFFGVDGRGSVPAVTVMPLAPSANKKGNVSQQSLLSPKGDLMMVRGTTQQV